MNYEQIAKQIAKTLQDSGGINPVVYDLTSKENYTKYLIFCSAKNEDIVLSISVEVEKMMNQVGIQPLRKEGMNRPNWVVIDFLDFVVHILTEHERDNYKIDVLYKTQKTLVF